MGERTLSETAEWYLRIETYGAMTGNVPNTQTDQFKS